MTDFTQYLLPNDNEIKRLKAYLGDKYDALYKSVSDYLANIPINEWVNPLRNVHPNNYAIIIGLICCYICEEPHTAEDLYEFSDGAGNIRHRVVIYTPISKKLLDDYNKKK